MEHLLQRPVRAQRYGQSLLCSEARRRPPRSSAYGASSRSCAAARRPRSDELLHALLSCSGWRCRLGNGTRDSPGADAASIVVCDQYLRNVLLDARNCYPVGYSLRPQARVEVARAGVRRRTLPRLQGPGCMCLGRPFFFLAEFLSGARSCLEALRTRALEAAATTCIAAGTTLAAGASRAQRWLGGHLSRDDERGLCARSAGVFSRRSPDRQGDRPARPI